MRRFQDITEASPDGFLRYDYPSLLDESRLAIAKLVNMHIDETVLIPNATTAANTVLRSLLFEPGDFIVCCDTIYTGCAKAVEYICETTPARYARVEFIYPISDAEVVEKYRSVIRKTKEAGQRPRLVVFDTISSLPGVRIPFEKLTKLCKEEGVLSLLDAAHGIGQIPLDLGALDADFAFSNLHKWLFTPRGSAALFVPFRNQHLIRSSIPTSHGFVPLKPSRQIPCPFPPTSKSPFVYLFEFTATFDDTPYLCIPAALKFRQEVCGGEARIMEYSQKLAQEGGKKVAELLGTEVLENEEGTLGKCALTNIRLPIDVAALEEGIRAKATAWMERTIRDEYNTFVVIFQYGGAFWVRFSGQIYLEEKDFLFGGKVLKELCEKFKGTTIE